MRLSTRSSDDADVIRARLRAVLDQSRRAPGWVPDDLDLPSAGVAEGSTFAHDVTADDEPTETLPEPAETAPLPAGLGRHRSPGTEVRLDPGRRGIWALCAAGLVAALVLVLWTWLDRPRVTPAPGRPAASTSAARISGASSPGVGEAAATSDTVVVSVVGLVARPGLVTVPNGSRVADAVTAAGGLLPDADPASVNMAAVVADGQQVAIGVPGVAAAGAGSASSATAGAGPVDLNTATVAELDALPGIGPVLAQRIIDYRSQQGRFTSVDQLDDVPGIGPALYGRLVGSVTV